VLAAVCIRLNVCGVEIWQGPLACSGNKGLMIGHVKIGATVGNGGTAAALPPQPMPLTTFGNNSIPTGGAGREPLIHFSIRR
jgi:hypothetical protein